MKIYKNGVLYYECTDTETVEAMVNSVTNDLNQNHYTKSEVMNLIASSRSIVQVATMPANPTRNTLYYVGTSSPYQTKLVDSNGTIVDMGTSEVDLSDYVAKTSIATSFSSSSTNEQVAGAKGIFDYVNSQTYYLYKCKRASSSLNLSDCLFNFDSEIGATQNPTTQIICSKMFPYVNMVSPISNSTIEGQLEVVEKVYKSTSTYNVYVEETFIRNQGSNKEQFEIYKRKGYANGITINNLMTDLITAINTNLTWKAWYPLEYPRFTLTMNNAYGGNNSKLGCSITGGILTINADTLQLSNLPTTAGTSVVIASGAPISIAKPTGTVNPYYHGMYVDLANTAKVYPVSVRANGDVAIFSQGTASVILYGQILIPLGY